ncbi:TIR domain-containing protein [Acaryochloris sp. CCMEE 5410]|uniref:TIR domain-containing protein n=1 Tax=Acaryochloris sp. CCMEE 5410 TaxID=310037 RepID=UPI0002484DAF|nr:TIR domain-containing protein [Acaryochloris sp. CCMEE 5410]KAI9131139.1 TIR domain-containing protein [Acaryochloris sp. CCMEE 5410]
MRRVFISYHHRNEQYLKEHLLQLNGSHEIFVDCSVDTGDIDDDLEPQVIRQTIRRNYLSESTVLMLIVGRETKYRKHVDWELYSSMYNGTNFGRSGVVVLLAPNCESEYFSAPFDEIKSTFYPDVSNWISIDSREEYERRYPHLPPRIIDNLLKRDSKISVTNWSKVANDPEKLRLLIECAHNARTTCEYDMSRAMRMRDHNPN